MAEQNPIRYQDLISPDDSIEKLIGQLEALQQSYTNMANSVKSQAQQVADSLTKVSGATEQGRKKIKESNDEASRLEKAYRQLDAALGENAKEIAKLNVIRREANNYQKMMVLRGKEEISTMQQIKEASYQQLSAQYSLNKAYLNNISAVERENAENKQLVETTREIYEQMKRLQEATGKYQLNVGNYENAITSAIGVNTKWYSGIKEIGAIFEGGFANGMKAAGSAVASFGKQLLALLANPIVATIAVISAAFVALAKGISSSEENTNALNRILAPFRRTLEAVLNVLQSVATFVLKVVEGFENMAMATSRLMEKIPLLGNAFRKVNRELEKSIELEREKQALQKDGRELTKQEAKTQYEIAVLRRKAQETNDPREQAALLEKAVKKERKMSADRVAYIQRELAVLRERSKQSQNDSELNDEIARKEAELWNARTQAEQRSLRMVGKIRQAENKMNASGTTRSSGTTDNSLKEQEQRERESLALRRKYEDITLELIDDEMVKERTRILIGYDRQIEDLRLRLEKEKTLTVDDRKVIDAQIVALEQIKQTKLADLVEKGAKKEQEAIEKKRKLEEQAAQQTMREREKSIELQYQLSMEEIEQLETSEKEKTRLRLEAEKERLQKLLALYQQDGKKLADEEIKLIKKQIEGVDKELQKNKKDYKDLYDVLGFNLSEEKKQAIDTSLQYALDGLNQFMDAYAAAADKKRELADAEVERTKNVLQAEIEARANGYANEVETARKEYEEAKKNQQKAIEQQKKAQKAQEAVQTVQQAGNLITASALIWSQLGFPWAIPAIAIMWGSFAAAKIKAAQVAGSGTEEYGEGTVELLEGGSHQSGNDIDLGRKPDGTRRRAEGGEYFAVINKRNSRKYRDLIPDVINSLNAGTFADKYMNAYDGGAVGVVAQGADLSRLEAGVDRINGNLEKPVMYFDGRGNQVLIYKNVKRVIKN